MILGDIFMRIVSFLRQNRIKYKQGHAEAQDSCQCVFPLLTFQGPPQGGEMGPAKAWGLQDPSPLRSSPAVQTARWEGNAWASGSQEPGIVV